MKSYISRKLPVETRITALIFDFRFFASAMEVLSSTNVQPEKELPSWGSGRASHCGSAGLCGQMLPYHRRACRGTRRLTHQSSYRTCLAAQVPLQSDLPWN